MAENNVIVQETGAYIDLQRPDGSVMRYFPITRIIDVIGSKELTKKEKKVLEFLMCNPYIRGTNSDGEPTIFRLEVENGDIYVTDQLTQENGKVSEFEEYLTFVSQIFG